MRVGLLVNPVTIVQDYADLSKVGIALRSYLAHARTFTFDRAWVEIARTDPPE